MITEESGVKTWRELNIPLKRFVGGPRRAIFFLSHTGDGDGDGRTLSLGGLGRGSCKLKSGN
jgi:hypothetical protein